LCKYKNKAPGQVIIIHSKDLEMSSSVSTENAAAKFAVIKSKVLSYMDEMTKKENGASTENATSTDQGTTTNSTDNMKLQFTTLLEKVTSFVNKQEDSKGGSETGTTKTTTEGEEGEKSSSGSNTNTFSAEDLQAKLTTFVKSISLAKTSTSTPTETTETTSTESSTTSDDTKKDPVKDIMNQLKTAFPQLMNKGGGSNNKDRSLGTIDESAGADGSSKPNPIEEFFSFVQGILHKDNIEKNVQGATETVKDSAASAQKSIDEGPEKNPILCGAF